MDPAAPFTPSLLADSVPTWLIVPPYFNQSIYQMAADKANDKSLPEWAEFMEKLSQPHAVFRVAEILVGDEDAYRFPQHARNHSLSELVLHCGAEVSDIASALSIRISEPMLQTYCLGFYSDWDEPVYAEKIRPFLDFEDPSVSTENLGQWMDWMDSHPMNPGSKPEAVPLVCDLLGLIRAVATRSIESADASAKAARLESRGLHDEAAATCCIALFSPTEEGLSPTRYALTRHLLSLTKNSPQPPLWVHKLMHQALATVLNQILKEPANSDASDLMAAVAERLRQPSSLQSVCPQAIASQAAAALTAIHLVEVGGTKQEAATLARHEFDTLRQAEKQCLAAPSPPAAENVPHVVHCLTTLAQLRLKLADLEGPDASILHHTAAVDLLRRALKLAPEAGTLIFGLGRALSLLAARKISKHGAEAATAALQEAHALYQRLRPALDIHDTPDEATILFYKSWSRVLRLLAHACIEAKPFSFKRLLAKVTWQAAALVDPRELLQQHAEISDRLQIACIPLSDEDTISDEMLKQLQAMAGSSTQMHSLSSYAVDLPFSSPDP